MRLWSSKRKADAIVARRQPAEQTLRELVVVHFARQNFFPAAFEARYNRGMTERKSIAAPLLVVTGTALLLLVLYVFSWGPAYGQMQHGHINDAAFDTFYWPLIAAGERFPWIKKVLNDYGSSWI